jgi:hypothetical protein
VTPRRGTASNLDPHFLPPDLAPEPVYPLTADRGTATVGQFEVPAMQRADDLAVLDPAMAQRASGMRATARQSDDFRSGSKEGDSEAERVRRTARSFPEFVEPANRDPVGHSRSLCETHLEITCPET